MVTAPAGRLVVGHSTTNVREIGSYSAVVGASDCAPLAETFTRPVSTSVTASTSGIGLPAASITWKITGTLTPPGRVAPAVGVSIRMPYRRAWVIDATLRANDALPGYTAMTWCEPTARVEIGLLTAVPPTSATGPPNGGPSTVNCTVPAGVMPAG